MHYIRCCSELSALRDMPCDAELSVLIDPYEDVVCEFEGDLSFELLLIQAGEQLDHAERVCGQQLVVDGTFAFTVEAIANHDRWFEVIWIKSDDGSGLVILAEKGSSIDSRLLSACKRALATAADCPVAGTTF